MSVAGVADYLRGDAAYRQRFARRKLRGPLLRRQLLPAGLISIAAGVGAVWLLARWPA